MATKEKAKMICVPCKSEMNHHAEKLVDARTPEEGKQVDPALGGIIEQIHTCPSCGSIKTRIGS